MFNKEVENYLKSVEKLVLSPYKKGNDRWTIGYGNTFYENGSPVKATDKPITKERAEQLFNRISGNFYREVKELVTSSANSYQISALTSFAYNVGIEAFKKSTLLKVVNKTPNDFETIEKEFNKWNKSNGSILKGLIIRRQKEFLFYKKKTNIVKKIFDWIKEHKKIVIPSTIGAVLLIVGFFVFKKRK